MTLLRQRLICLPLLIVFTCMAVVTVRAQTAVNYKTEAQLFRKLVDAKHYNPPAIDDGFSQAWFDNFIDDVDPDRVLFTEPEIASLQSYRNKLDDEVNGSPWQFLTAFTSLYRQSLNRAIDAITKGTQAPFGFTSKESYAKDNLWAVDEVMLYVRWKLLMKAETAMRLAEMKTRFQSEDDQTFLKNHESEVRMLLRSKYQAKQNRIIRHAGGFENYVGAAFMHAMSHAVDAHTNYFSPMEMENFISQVSSEGFQFGFSLVENDFGDIVIDQLTPGGSAWKSGQIYKGDIITRVRWEGGIWIDFTGMEVSEAGDVLDQSNDLALEFELRDISGQPKNVSLKKEKISDDNSIVKSFVLQGVRKIGYIYLPGFYTDWREGGSRCANDVAAAIIKLKKDTIAGLVLDIRFNGGGSLEEAVAMAGIFIDAGPIGILKHRNGDMVSVKDMNRGTIYDGPLVVMVNGMSASASEFLAAALQDYHRAIIVGSRTYGKATAQLPRTLDPKSTVSDFKTVTKNPYGYAMITEEKIYRINGRTAQRMGVRPDIELPDLIDALKLREEDQSNTLPSDSVIKKTYYQTLLMPPLKAIAERSEARVKASKIFNEQYAVIKSLRQRKNDDAQSLQWTDVVRERKVRSEFFSAFTESSPTKAYTVVLNKADQQSAVWDDYSHDVFLKWTQRLAEDKPVEEAFYIVNDLITLTKK